MCPIGYSPFAVSNWEQSKEIAPSPKLIVGQRVFHVNEWLAENIISFPDLTAAFDSVGIWHKIMSTTNAVERKTLFGDCNINDASPFLPGLELDFDLQKCMKIPLSAKSGISTRLKFMVTFMVTFYLEIPN